MDRTFGEAWARLAWRYVWEVRPGRTEMLDSARGLAEAAVELEPELGYAHYALASVSTAEVSKASLHAFREALRLNGLPSGSTP